MRAVVLVGGFGTRLRPITHTLPKPMVPLCNRPLIAWAIESARANAERNGCDITFYVPDELAASTPRVISSTRSPPSR